MFFEPHFAEFISRPPTKQGHKLAEFYSAKTALCRSRFCGPVLLRVLQMMKTFINTSLGETWMESGEAPDWQRLLGQKEEWRSGTVPAGGLFLTAGTDVQKDRIEVDVWAWGRGLQSWLIDHIVIEGGPGDPACWQKLSDLLGQTWAYPSGQHLTIARLAQQSGREFTSAIPMKRTGNDPLQAHANLAEIRCCPRFYSQPFQSRPKPLPTRSLQGQPHRCSCRVARPLCVIKGYAGLVATSSHSSDSTYCGDNKSLTACSVANTGRVEFIERRR